MSNIVYDSQNQRWMTPIPGTPAELIVNKYALTSNSWRCCKCATATCLITWIVLTHISAIFGLVKWPLLTIAKCLTGTVAASGAVGIVAVNSSLFKDNTTYKIQDYVEQNGWSDFKRAIPLADQRCFIVNYRELPV